MSYEIECVKIEYKLKRKKNRRKVKRKVGGGPNDLTFI